MDLTKKADYAAELKAWKEECEEQAVEFCITSKTELLDQYSSKCSSSTGTHSKASNRVSKIEHLENPLNKTSEPHLVESEPSDCSFPVFLISKYIYGVYCVGYLRRPLLFFLSYIFFQQLCKVFIVVTSNT